MVEVVFVVAQNASMSNCAKSTVQLVGVSTDYCSSILVDHVSRSHPTRRALVSLFCAFESIRNDVL